MSCLGCRVNRLIAISGFGVELNYVDIGVDLSGILSSDVERVLRFADN